MVVALTPYGGWHKEAKEWTDRVAHTGDKVPHDAWDERFEHPARTWASASHRAFTLQATGVAMANATYMFMRENSRFEMMRAVGAKAVASVEMAVPPTMVHVAGELNAEISEGETSGDDFSDGDYMRTDIRRITTPSGSKPQETSGSTPASNQVNIYTIYYCLLLKIIWVTAQIVRPRILG